MEPGGSLQSGTVKAVYHDSPRVKYGPQWPNCYHPRTVENTATSGTVGCCAICRTARFAAQKANTAARREAVAADFRRGLDPQLIADRRRMTLKRVKLILSWAGLIGRNAYDYKQAEYTQRVLHVAADLAGANVEQLCGKWRAPKQLVHARWCVMVSMFERGASISTIGRKLNRDHSTVIYGLRQAEYYNERRPDFADMLARVSAAIPTGLS